MRRPGESTPSSDGSENSLEARPSFQPVLDVTREEKEKEKERIVEQKKKYEKELQRLREEKRKAAKRQFDGMKAAKKAEQKYHKVARDSGETLHEGKGLVGPKIDARKIRGVDYRLPKPGTAGVYLHDLTASSPAKMAEELEGRINNRERFLRSLLNPNPEQQGDLQRWKAQVEELKREVSPASTSGNEDWESS